MRNWIIHYVAMMMGVAIRIDGAAYGARRETNPKPLSQGLFHAAESD